MKRLTIFATTAVLLAGCASAPVEARTVAAVNTVSTVPSFTTIGAKTIEANKNRELWDVKVPAVLAALKKRINKTWYVFSGSTPSGWDCSGLTMWAYKQLGVSIKHSATAQAYAGRWVKTPLPGDIVVWGYGRWFQHAAIYYGHGVAIHSGWHKGWATSFVRVDDPGFRGMTMRFVRVLPNPVK